MNEKKCFIPTSGSKCVKKPSDSNYDDCRFTPYYYSFETTEDQTKYTFGQSVGYFNADVCPSTGECFQEAEKQGKYQMPTQIENCLKTIQTIDKEILPNEPLLPTCMAKCTFLISIGEFIERHLHLKTQSNDHNNYFDVIYCPFKENSSIDKASCRTQMNAFYENFICS